ncbi:MAG: hypothetical protein SZ59_C0004G0093 [candidate division TM6 bacterium GW2011_GWF2_28_16]|nr:MAG: hypothetical protein SZ59_C0004G0093 [candidate division TM6 bacterium GW2011_GWF2_28_16]
MFKKFILFILIFKNIFSVNYPEVANDRQVNAYVTLATSVSGSGDTYSTGAASAQGFCWFKSKLDTNGTGTGGIYVATPLVVSRGLYLSSWNTLDLQKDLFLAADCNLERSGKVAPGIDTRNESALILLGNFDLKNNTLTFTGGQGRLTPFTINRNAPCYLDGNSCTIDFSSGGSIVQDTGPRGSLTIRNAILKGLKTVGSTPNLNIKTGDLYLDNIYIKLHGDYSIGSARKALHVYGDLIITGSYVFTIDGACYIYDDARIYLNKDTTLKLGISASINLRGTKTGGFYFNGSKIDISSKNFNQYEGRIIFENDIIIDDSSSSKLFVLGPACSIDCLANARVLLEGTTTFSII